MAADLTDAVGLRGDLLAHGGRGHGRADEAMAADLTDAFGLQEVLARGGRGHGGDDLQQAPIATSCVNGGQVSVHEPVRDLMS